MSNTTMPMAPAPMAPAPMQPAPEPARRTSVCAIVGTVFGGLGLLLSFIPIINNAAAVFGAVGVVLGVVALVGTFRGKRSGKPLAIVATVLSVLSIIITLSLQASWSNAIDEAFSDASATSAQEASGDASASESEASEASEAVMEGEGELKNLRVSIESGVRSADDYEGNPTILVTYAWTNLKDENASFMVAADYKAFQNGQQLDSAIYYDAPEGYEAGAALSELQPGANGTVAIGYVLKDDSPVTVEVEDFLSTTGKKVTRTFDLQ